MNFPYIDDNNNIHVEACYTYPRGVYYKCSFCFTCKNGTGPTGYDTYNTPLTKSGTVAKHRINKIHIHGNLFRNPKGGYVAETGRSDKDNWVDGPKSPHCCHTGGDSWQSSHPSICNNNVYVHVTENTRRFTVKDAGLSKTERYQLVLMPNFTYPTLLNRDGEFTPQPLM